mmetsp:Transcript_60342/g.82788  ORF Transcript_60342/g.82788 Transcript_60342/m.82788 type:complete len:115 (+) Transcript_60342:300-644(+)
MSQSRQLFQYLRVLPVENSGGRINFAGGKLITYFHITVVSEVDWPRWGVESAGAVLGPHYSVHPDSFVPGASTLCFAATSVLKRIGISVTKKFANISVLIETPLVDTTVSTKAC